MSLHRNKRSSLTGLLNKFESVGISLKHIKNYANTQDAENMWELKHYVTKGYKEEI